MPRMAETSVQTRILCFGRLAEMLGREREIDIPESGCTVAELRERLQQEAEGLVGLLAGNLVVAIDQAIATDDATIMPGQEIAVFSPLSGG
jgi:molybdopterin synthase sulfur carrier subunit